MATFLGPALLIFSLRLVDVSLYTLRIMMVVRGRKALALGFAFCQAFAYVISLRVVLSDLGNWSKIIGYAAGFATGLVIGMWLENRLAVGYTHLQIVSSRLGADLAEHLREAGYAVTEIPARGQDGAVTMLSCNLKRKQTEQVCKIIEQIDPTAFVTAESVRRIQRGFWRK
ncbi:MAG: DUF2179 domain-containing protein [Anaerolineales bacterium]|nr:DUF2179 domain-containing protein [Anaerolineales bacterium]